MLVDYNFTVKDRFLRYVQIDTQSDPNSNSNPSSEKQKILSVLLASELKDMGIKDAHADEFGYVYATIPSNSTKQVPVICFCAHIDTAPDCSGTDVKPMVHENYSGNDIVLPDDPTQILTATQYPYLLKQLGGSIITASGKTLLGGDDKAGVSIIMDMAHFLMQHPEIPHGVIRLLFTPDEEVGRGTDKLDMKKLNANFY
jgi:tripeptide aminopeptidase